MSSDKDTLLSMGFDPTRVEWAIKATNGRGLQPAMDFLLENDGKPVPDLSSIAAPTSSSGSGAPMDVDGDDREELEALQAVYGKAQIAGGEAAEAKSIKCSQCDKIFKTTALANYHAEKSGHDQFEESTEEIKPLTEEEKRQRLADLKEKMAAKRMVKSKEEAKEQQANEAIRRKAGRDMNEVREEMKAKEIKKDLEAKKREKVEEAQARARVKAQIEADKRERAEKAAREKALREGKPLPESSAAPVAAAPPPAAPKSGKDYPETRLQIRMASGGQPYTTTLPSDSTLREVAEFLAAQTLSVDVETVTFAMHFPRKQFTRSDLSKSLRDLGLTPSAVRTSDLCAQGACDGVANGVTPCSV
ncbi:ubiquitin-related domain-containing protein [Fomitopsis serialis]|uniref:ubiquitin-related domain-containing protein n=1 Tax=Fomitopsis serialis TaxID=139415 RepID=UPI00200877CD|nr:ubiquitin-related domain-containing protein [Neoantrodia serialis]KAH9926984.1 ubiquitin-related domain-containing protein [Neoantrodia serialis]